MTECLAATKVGCGAGCFAVILGKPFLKQSSLSDDVTDNTALYLGGIWIGTLLLVAVLPKPVTQLLIVAAWAALAAGALWTLGAALFGS